MNSPQFSVQSKINLLMRTLNDGSEGRSRILTALITPLRAGLKKNAVADLRELVGVYDAVQLHCDGSEIGFDQVALRSALGDARALIDQSREAKSVKDAENETISKLTEAIRGWKPPAPEEDESDSIEDYCDCSGGCEDDGA